MEVYYATKNGTRIGSLHQTKKGAIKDLISFLGCKERGVTRGDINIIVEDIEYKGWFNNWGTDYEIKSETVLT